MTNCDNNTDRRGGCYELVSLSGEYSKHLSSVVLNNVNYIPMSNFSFLSFFNKMFSIYFQDYFLEPFDLFDGFINLICQSSNSCSECQCTCTCSKTPCDENFICLCLCSDAKTEGTECCICICKKKEEKNNCKCVCICICKDRTSCGTKHNCENCSVKVDIGTLKDQTSEILNYLCLINCYISKLENPYVSNNRCCSCSCSIGRCSKPSSCSTYCCCKQGKTNYLEIILTIQWIEYLFRQVREKITELRTLKNILSPLLVIATKCSKCPGDCCKDINRLIENIESALRYYYLFGSRIEDIGSFVEYKLNYNKSKQIISSLQRSMRPFLNQLGEINSDIIKAPNHNMSTFNKSLVQINKLLMGVYSNYSMRSTIFLLMRVTQWAEFINYFFNTNEIVDICFCLKAFQSKNNIYQNCVKGYSNYTNDIDTSILSKLNKQTRENHICLCLVFKYVLYPSIMTSLYLVFGTNLEIIGTYDRRYDNYNFIVFNNDVSKMLLFVFHFISVIINIISRDSYVKWTTGGGIRVDIKCFCMNDKYDKNYLISIILFVSSLVENISSMDKHLFQVFVNHLSSLMWEFDMTNNNNIKVELNEALITLTKSTSYFSSLGVTDSGLRLIIHGSNEIVYSLNNILDIDESVEETYRFTISCNIKLFYENFTFLSFYILKNSKIIGKDKRIKKLNMKMSHRYLSITLKNGSVCDQNKCEGCKKFIYKIVYYVICILRDKHKIMSGQITNSSIIKFINQNKRLELHEIINYLNKRTIDGTEMILRVTKNKLLNSSSHPNLNTENIVKSRNWGYDTHFEHHLTDNRISESDGYPNINSGSNNLGKRNKIFKLMLSRVLVDAMIKRMFIYMFDYCDTLILHKPNTCPHSYYY